MPSVDRYGGAWREPNEDSATVDAWRGMAPYSPQPLPLWRESLVAEFLTPRTGPGVTALEACPGVGDWTEQVLGSVQKLIVVDRRAEMLEGIRERFGPRGDLREVLIVNHRLTGIPDASVDLAYSLDFFPYVEWSLLERWLGELSRVLRPGGHLVLHHAATPRRLRTVAPRRTGLDAARTPLSGLAARVPARRQPPNGSAATFTGNGLVITRQTSTWGPAGEFTVDKYRDVITVARKPAIGPG